MRWIADISADYAVIALAMLGAHLSAWAIIPAVFVIGTRQHAILILGHDGAHSTISRRRWLNDGLTNLLCFWPFGLGLSGYRVFHFGHHRWLGTARDPELYLKATISPAYDPPLHYRWIVTAAMGGGIRESIIAGAYIRARCSRRDRLAPALWWAVAGGALWATGAWWIAALWLAALATSLPVVFRLRVWTEHIGTTGTLRFARRPALWRRLVYLPHGAWKHWSHHANPAAPYWDLQA